MESLPSSFRDPSGCLLSQDGVVYRSVNTNYKENYDHLISSGLYRILTDENLLVRHDEVNNGLPRSSGVYKIIEPEAMGFISYPYEWCFSQLKDAALLTLKIQKKALELGMSLKDASAFNIQFVKGRPIFIDTLSFEIYREGQPWVAYRQFCQHFLAPLALMSYKNNRLNQLLQILLDGIPLDLASLLLPARTYLSLSLFLHIHLHARAQKYFARKVVVNGVNRQMTRRSFLGLIDNLKSAVKTLRWKAEGTTWADYYGDTNYSPYAFEHKKKVVGEFLDESNPKSVWDLGANIGTFSRIASAKGIAVVSFDIEPAAVEINYLRCVKDGETRILPLLLDLTNPSPAIGWQNQERMSLLERGPVDVVLALAVVHHLAIANNVPFHKIAAFFSRICKWLIIEFIPKSDSRTERLLRIRKDVFPNYTKQAFESEFDNYFAVKHSVELVDSGRTLYLMAAKEQ